MAAIKHHAKDEYSLWHRLRLPKNNYSTDVDYIEIRIDRKGTKWWAAVVEVKRYYEDKIKELSHIQSANMNSLGIALDLPYFIIYYQAKIRNLRTHIDIENDLPEKFLIRPGNKQADELLQSKNIKPATWIPEEQFIEFMASLPLKTKMPDQDGKLYYTAS